MDVLKRQEQLDLKEKELNAREAELKEQMVRDGTLKPKKNWPKFYPITNHDIAADVSNVPWPAFPPWGTLLQGTYECRASAQILMW